MSSNFYTSSHHLHHLHSRPSIYAARAIDRLYATPHQIYCLGIWFANLIQKLCKKLSLRQMVIATATVYFRRFYLKSSYCETNPYLVLAACVFVAAKVEETPVHIKSIVSEAKMIFGEYNIKSFPAETNRLGEMEFYLLEDLDFHLVIFHPYRSILAMCGREPSDAGRFPKSRIEEDSEIRKKESEARKRRDEEIRKAGPGKGTGTGTGTGTTTPAMMGGTPGPIGDGGNEFTEETEEQRLRRLMSRGSGEGLMDIEDGVLQIGLFVLNDSYRTEVHLLYPPHIIALAALYVGFALSAMTPQSTRTRSSTTQVTSNPLVDINAALNLPPTPNGAAEFLASFEVNLGVVMSCVQDILILYPIWEKFEPNGIRPGSTSNQSNNNNNNNYNVNSNSGSSMTPINSGSASAVINNINNRMNNNLSSTTTTTGQGRSTSSRFGPEEAEALVRRMIEERMIDVGHPDNAGKEGKDVQVTRGTGVIGGGNGSPSQIVGKKRGR